MPRGCTCAQRRRSHGSSRLEALGARELGCNRNVRAEKRLHSNCQRDRRSGVWWERTVRGGVRHSTFSGSFDARPMIWRWEYDRSRDPAQRSSEKSPGLRWILAVGTMIPGISCCAGVSQGWYLRAMNVAGPEEPPRDAGK
jgi:hypothetical protein